MNALGMLYENQGRYDEALAHYQRDLAMSVEAAAAGWLAAIHVTTITKPPSNSSVFHRSRPIKSTCFPSVKPYVERENVLCELCVNWTNPWTVATTGGEDTEDIANTLNSMAIVYTNQGRLDEALEHYERALGIAIKAGAGVSLSGIEECTLRTRLIDSWLERCLLFNSLKCCM